MLRAIAWACCVRSSRATPSFDQGDFFIGVGTGRAFRAMAICMWLKPLRRMSITSITTSGLQTGGRPGFGRFAALSGAVTNATPSDGAGEIHHKTACA